MKTNVIFYPLTFVLVMSIIFFMRLQSVPSTKFYEGDDAAISSGIVRLCNSANIGPYFYHPPYFSQAEYDAYKNNKLIPRFNLPLNLPYYRYNTMIGVYFVGYLSCPLDHVIDRMLFYCFFAGLFFPLFLSFFLYKLFSPLPAWILFVLYVLISISPEAWFSGSAYLNDKILAIFFLSLTLFFTSYSDVPSFILNMFLSSIAGAAFGLAILMRFDTILFSPVILLLVYIFNKKRHFLYRIASTGLFLVIAIATVFSITKFMQGSIALAFSQGTHSSSFSIANIINKFDTISVGLGVFPLLQIGALLLIVIGIVIDPENKPFSIPIRHFIRLDGWKVLFIVYFIIVEIVFLLSFPFSSTKYLLFGSALISALFPLISVKVWGIFKNSTIEIPPSLEKLVVIGGIAMVILPITIGIFPLGDRFASGDGIRYDGGWLFQQVRPDHEALLSHKFFICQERILEKGKKAIVINSTSWMVEESIAYEAAMRGWHNKIIPMDMPVTIGGKMRFPGLNVYSDPNSAISIYVPSQADLIKYPDIFINENFRKVAGTDVTVFDNSRLRKFNCNE